MILSTVFNGDNALLRDIDNFMITYLFNNQFLTANLLIFKYNLSL